MLNTLTPEADACCMRQWKKLKEEAIETMESFVCDRCGCEYRPVVEGLIRFWKAHVWAARI